MPGSADVPGCRVALVLGTSGGGMAAHVRMLATGLADRGAQVTVLGPRSVARGGQVARGTRVSFGIVEIGDRPRLQDAGVPVRLRRLLAGAEVVHAHGLRAGALCALALCWPALHWPALHWSALHWPALHWPALRGSGSGGRPALVVTVHNAPPSGGVAALVYRALEVVVARGADAVLCVSGDLEARMRAAGARRVGHAVVPAPAAGAAGDSLAPGGWPAGERPVVLGAGRLTPQKGFGVLLEAAASWADMDPAPLVVIAGDGPLREELRGQAAALGIDAQFLGHRDDVPALLAAAAVFALPSLWEGQPLILQEALRAGVPVVATRAGGIPGLTAAVPAASAGGSADGGSADGDRAGGDRADGGRADGAAAVLVRPGDRRELAAAVRAVLTDQALAARLRAAALRRAACLPSPADAITAILAAYADARQPPARAPKRRRRRAVIGDT